jgi:TPR repeat protein
MHATGQGVARDLEQAAAWYEKAAEGGHALAQHNVAVMLAKGQGCAQDREKAALWHRKAADQGLEQSRAALAAMGLGGDRKAPQTAA